MGSRSRIPSEAEPALKRFAISPFVQLSNQYPMLNLGISRPRKLSVVGEKSERARLTTAIIGMTLWLKRREPFLGGIERSIPRGDQFDPMCVWRLMKSGKKLVGGHMPFSPTTDMRLI